MDDLIQSLYDKARLRDEETFSSDAIVGRVVSLKSIESKPELNGRYGLIKEYKEAKGRYLIQLLDYSPCAANATYVLMKYEKLVVLAPKKYRDSSQCYYQYDWDQFIHKYHLKCACDEIGRCIVNIPSGISTPNPVDLQIHLMFPCFVKGVPGTITCNKGYHMPISSISALLHINSIGLIEVENVLFTPPKNALTSLSVGKGRVVFRWCRFKGNSHGIQATANDIPLHITFENCIFDSSTCGAFIGGGAHAVFLNCHFINHSYAAIGCQRSGQVDAIASTFTSNKMGFDISDKTTVCNVSYCSIVNSKSQGILVIDGAKAVLKNCYILSSVLSAVAVDSATLHAIDCKFEESLGSGLQFRGKYCDAKVDDCIIANNKDSGVYIVIDCTGQLLFSRCSMRNNVGKNIENNGLSKCKLIIDGTVFVTNGEVAAAYNANPSNLTNCLMFEQESNASEALKNHRSLKSAGLIDIAPTCGHCLKLETPGIRFDKCSVCMGIVYCTKECQKLNWKIHKKICKPTVKHPTAYDPTVNSNYFSNFKSILTSIPATHKQIKVSDLLLNATHDSKYVVGVISSFPRGFKETIVFSINPDNDSCDQLLVELEYFYFFDFDYSKMVVQDVEKESGLFVGRRVCLLNPHFKLKKSKNTISSSKLHVVLL